MNIHAPITAVILLDFARKTGAVILALSALSIFGVVYAQSTEQEGSFQPSFEITPLLEGGKITVTGKTNLPEQTKIILLLQFDIEGEQISREDTPIVHNGEFKSSVFDGQNNGPLPSGIYILRTKVLPVDQPAGLAELIGVRGKNLAGPYVTTVNGRRLIKFEKEIPIKGEESDALRQKLDTELRENQTALLELRRELDDFKSTSKFHRFGFAPAGYEEWATRVHAVKKRDKSERGNYRAASTVIIQLGVEYLRSKGEENESTQFHRNELSQYLGEKK